MRIVRATSARIVLALAIALGPAGARAQDRDGGASTGVPQRPIPDYGRAPEPPEPAEALLWIPRIVFLPVHLVLEYLVRLPLAWTLRTIEIERLDAVFRREEMPQLASRRQAAWSFVPRFRYDFRLQPSVGVGFRAHDPSERFRLGAGFSFWGKEQVAGDLRLSARFGALSVALDGRGSFRSDGIFQGLGWDAPRSPRARYAEGRGGAGAFVTARLWRSTDLTAGTRVAVHRFDDTSFHQSGDVSLEGAIASGAIEAPPGYPEGYTVFEGWLRFLLDTREEGASALTTGARADLVGALAMDVERGTEASWASAHAEVELALEVMRDRSLSLRSLVAIAEALGSRAIPFTEQVWLGQDLLRMPGFLPGWLIGESAATLGLAWRYAVWAWVDAALFADVGNVFGPHFTDFDVERLRLSFGTALMAHDADDFTLLLAFGTDPFVLGGDITSVRFAFSIGAPPDFPY